MKAVDQRGSGGAQQLTSLQNVVGRFLNTIDFIAETARNSKVDEAVITRFEREVEAAFGMLYVYEEKASRAASEGPDPAAIRAELNRLPEDATAFLQDVVLEELQFTLTGALEKLCMASDKHGFKLASGSPEKIMLAWDAVTDAVLGSEVDVDMPRQTAIKRALQARLAAADKNFQQHLKRMAKSTRRQGVRP